MIFYDCATAPSPRRARMFIAEKGLEIDTRDVSIAKGEQLQAAFLAINPGATVPVLVTDDGQTLTENIGIATYLEAAHSEPPLLGRTPAEKAEIAQWNAICEQKGGAPIAEVLRNANPAMKGRAIPGQANFDQIPALAERGQIRVVEFYDLLEARLTQRPWLGGATFSLADITGYVFVDFARVIRARIPEANVKTRAWYETMGARASARL